MTFASLFWLVLYRGGTEIERGGYIGEDRQASTAPPAPAVDSSRRVKQSWRGGAESRWCSWRIHYKVIAGRPRRRRREGVNIDSGFATASQPSLKETCACAREKTVHP